VPCTNHSIAARRGKKGKRRLVNILMECCKSAPQGRLSKAIDQVSGPIWTIDFVALANDAEAFATRFHLRATIAIS
jgi:hypothetical protein